jgi:hypothetical protein
MRSGFCINVHGKFCPAPNSLRQSDERTRTKRNGDLSPDLTQPFKPAPLLGGAGVGSVLQFLPHSRTRSTRRTPTGWQNSSQKYRSAGFILQERGADTLGKIRNACVDQHPCGLKSALLQHSGGLLQQSDAPSPTLLASVPSFRQPPPGWPCPCSISSPGP